ncbi:hypothetical protein NT2_14_00100 [Caenibius tardaugens NBRC 16725]|uniref:Uncharacterized protein n=1 Tax=Caenibius tardaugens NBRC 16725 TaxID=1219035 RepID=U2YBU5_9SPHN|nr:hypothetical protein NT2_14_00100 [Caenibius tardaugens NBRC 16725]
MRDDVRFSRRRFFDEGAQGLCGVLYQPGADGALAIDEPPDGTFVYAEAPRSSGGAAEYLNAVGEVRGEILRFG